MSQTDEVNPGGNFIGIDDPDISIYRVYPLWRFFEEALRLRHLVLVQPSSWSDPYEQLIWSCKVINKGSGRQFMTHPCLWPVYAQCWSATKESETLLRAYSRVVRHPLFRRNQCPGEEGVTVRSTPRKLLESLQAWAPDEHKDHCYIGRVKYFDSEGVRAHVGEFFSRHPPDTKVSAMQTAELMLLKRSTFEHENEIRLIYVETRDGPPPDRISCEFDPNEIFDAVKFDPRLGSEPNLIH
jgi:hypothetical protein